MNKFIKLSLIISLTLTIFTSSVLADNLKFNLNAALTSNYVWRGMTQTQDEASIQGGAKMSYNGLHANVLATSVKWQADKKTETYELDYTAGYTLEYAGMECDISYCAFTYPQSTIYDFAETKMSLSSTIDDITLGYSYSIAMNKNNTLNKTTDNTEVSISVGRVDIIYGSYDKVGTYHTVSYTMPFGLFEGTIAYSSGLQSKTTDIYGATEDSKVIGTISYTY
jgi:uncharacterized protein (TIGR02001 family)